MSAIDLTKREKIALVIAAILYVAFFFIPQRALERYEVAYLIFVVAPLGLYLATDRERINKRKDK